MRVERLHVLYLAHSSYYKQPFPTIVHPLSPFRNKVQHLPLYHPKNELDPERKLIIKKNSIETVDLNTFIRLDPGYTLEFFTEQDSEIVCLNSNLRGDGVHLKVDAKLWNVSCNDYVHDHLKPLVNLHVLKNGARVYRTGDNFYLKGNKVVRDFRSRFIMIKEMRQIIKHFRNYSL